jgi:hypothetical protein
MATTTTAAPHAVPTIHSRLLELGISRNVFGELLGISSGEISQLLRAPDLDGPHAEKFEEMVSSLEQLALMFYPMPVSWKNCELVKRLIRSYKADPEAAERVQKSLAVMLQAGMEVLSGSGQPEVKQLDPPKIVEQSGEKIGYRPSVKNFG